MFLRFEKTVPGMRRERTGVGRRLAGEEAKIDRDRVK